MTSYYLTKVPGFTNLPDCASFAVVQGVEVVSYGRCQRSAATTVYVSCLCGKISTDVTNSISNLVTFGSYKTCGADEVSSALSAFDNYCSLFTAGQIFTTAASSGSTHSTTTALPGPTSTSHGGTTPTSSVGGNDEGATRHPNLDAGAKIGIAVGVVVAFLLACFAAFAIGKKRGWFRNTRAYTHDDDPDPFANQSGERYSMMYQNPR